MVYEQYIKRLISIGEGIRFPVKRGEAIVHQFEIAKQATSKHVRVRWVKQKEGRTKTRK